MLIDPAAITLVQTNFLQHLQAIFAAVSRYALNLLYLFAVLELALTGLMWAFESSVAWGKFFFKILKIGLIFLVIQNYNWLLSNIVNSFSQIAGLTINSAKLAGLIFNPAAIWQYGYDAGLFLLQQAVQTSNLGLTIVQSGLGMGILLTFGLLGIQIIMQVVGFYLVALVALLLLPFGVFQPSSKMFDRAVQAVLESGVRVMALIMVIGVAMLVWDNFSLTEMAAATVNISQPLGLFFTALLFLSLAHYLPRIAALTVGAINSGERDGNAAAAGALAGEAQKVQPISVSDLAAMRDASMVDVGLSAGLNGGYAGSLTQGTEMAPAAASIGSSSAFASGSGGAAENLSANLAAKDLMSQASTIQHSISRETIRQMKGVLNKLMEDKK